MPEETQTQRQSNIEIGVPTEYGFALAQQRFEQTMPHVRPGAQSLLDVGCGNGANTVLFARSLPKVAGVDVEPERLATAREFAEANGIDNIEYVISDGLNIPYPDDSFDYVTCFDVLEHVEDEQKTMSEIARVLRPGGKLIMSVPNKWYLMEVHGFHFKPDSVPWNRVPLLSWLPTPIHERYARARIYSKQRIMSVMRQARFEVLEHEYAMPPFDLVGSPQLRRQIIALFAALERTPLKVIGLRHFIVAVPPATSPAAAPAQG
jgi:ubiquinone/menaquinone biosynthesis C-methylase UbiE